MARPLRERYPGAAVITGASSGIGEAYARRLAREGFDVILVARRKERLRALAEELQDRFNIRTRVVAVDLADRSGPAEAFSGIRETGWPVGMLINNAGVGVYGLFEETDASREAIMIDLNCRAPVLLTHLLLPPMLERGRGAILIVASIAAFQSTPRFAVYGATKAFDLYLAESLHVELKPKGIDVLGVIPGPTSTEFNQVSGYRDKPPFSRSPEDVVNTSFRALGKKISVADGFPNKLGGFLPRLFPRKWVTRSAGWVMRPKSAASKR